VRRLRGDIPGPEAGWGVMEGNIEILADRVGALASKLSQEAAVRRERMQENNYQNWNSSKAPGKTIKSEAEVVTALDAMSLSEVQIMSMLDVGWVEARNILQAVASACVPSVESAASIWQRQKPQSSQDNQDPQTRDSSRDPEQRLGGDLSVKTSLELVQLLPGHLVEIVGRAGAGKTQFCITTAVEVVAQTGRGVAYIDTENKFSAQRTSDIIGARFGSHRAYDLAKKITVFSPRNSTELEADLREVENLAAKKDLALILVDSVAALVERSGTKAGAAYSAQTLMRLAARLKMLGETCQAATLVTNQVTNSRANTEDRAVDAVSSSDVFGIQDHDRWDASTSSSRYNKSDGHEDDMDEFGATREGQPRVHVMAALGNTWAHAVNVRVVFELLGDDEERCATLKKAPHLMDASQKFRITEAGVDQTGPLRYGMSS